MGIRAKWIGRERAQKALDLIDPNINAVAYGMLFKAGKELAEQIKKYAPVEQGDYRDSIHADRMENRPDAITAREARQGKNPNNVGIFAAWYWRWLEFGARPHKIKAKNVQYMTFEGRDGRMKYAREVNHPGAPPQPHIFPVYRSERKNMRRKLSRAVARAIKKAIANQQATPADGESA